MAKPTLTKVQDIAQIGNRPKLEVETTGSAEQSMILSSAWPKDNGAINVRGHV